jgi:predicted PurR-regulated permease PerM
MLGNMFIGSVFCLHWKATCSEFDMTNEIARFGRRVFAVVMIVGLFFAVAYSIQVLLLIFAGILMAILFRGAGTWLAERTGLSIAWSMALVLLSFGVFLFGSIWMFGVQIAEQTDQLFVAVSQAYEELRHKLAQYHMAGGLSTGGINLEAPAKAAASGALWTFASIVIVLFLGVYLSTAPQLYTELFLSFFDSPLRRRVARLLNAMAAALRWWILGQLIAMAVVGLITTVGLLMVGAPMPVSLGVMAMVFTFVPYVGAIVSAVPAILLAFTKSGDLAISVIIVYFVAHVIEGYIIVPLIQHKLVYLPPAMILAMQFLMELFAGMVGVTLATPLMVVGMVLIKKLYFKQEWYEPTEEAEAA